MFFFLSHSGTESVPENTGNLTQSASSDLNQISTDTTDRTIANMSKKKDSYSKDNIIVPTYSDGSINYDGTIITFYFI